MLEKLNHPDMIIVVGRANSGTRVLPEVLQDAGVYFGEPLNVASDLLPEEHIYAACRLFGPNVKYLGKHQWDFSQVNEMEIPEEFIRRLSLYLKPLIDSDAPKKGWKIPNNTLIFPWLVRLLPKASFVYWVRHPEGNCAKMTGVDRLEKWGIPCKKYLFHDFNYKIRVVSWKYHVDIVKASPRPENFAQFRFEDYVLNQSEEKKRLEKFVGMELGMRDLNKGKAGPYTRKLGRRYKILAKPMAELGYE